MIVRSEVGRLTDITMFPDEQRPAMRLAVQHDETVPVGKELYVAGL